MNDQALMELALSARNNAYAPYSSFRVGAALLTTDGRTFVGCNVENSSYGLSICAERHAIGNMIAAGHKQIEKIFVAATPLASPCGACRQFIVEFGSHIEVVSFDADDVSNMKRWNIVDLIPDYFRFPGKQ